MEPTMKSKEIEVIEKIVGEIKTMFKMANDYENEGTRIAMVSLCIYNGIFLLIILINAAFLNFGLWMISLLVLLVIVDVPVYKLWIEPTAKKFKQ